MYAWMQELAHLYVRVHTLTRIEAESHTYDVVVLMHAG